MKGLLIRKPWIDMILDGEKTWEIRGSRTTIRGRIALIESGTGTVVGTCDVIDVIGPLSVEKLRRTTKFHSVPAKQFADGVRYKTPYGWVLKNAQRSKTPIRYRHPPGAVIWVNLSRSVIRRIEGTPS